MKKIGSSLALVAVLLALLPAATQAKTIEEKTAANAANDAARCMLKAQGVALPGKVAPSTPAAAAACAAVYTSVEARALQALPSTARIACPFVGPVTQARLLPLWDYQIKKAKAEAKGKPVPLATPNIIALEACV
ncbi:MAG: hypothetical protein NVSMB2_15190 [Chloroflexota bacterium]